MFKFLSKNLRLKIVSQFNFIHFFNLFLFVFKKLKFISMIKMTVKIYHDSTSAHKFRNKITKFKIERLMFFSSKSIKNGQFAFILTEEFGELTVENQILFAKNYETAKKKQNMHENILKSHAAELAREEKKYWNQIKKWTLKKRLWKWKTIVMLFDECFFQFYFFFRSRWNHQIYWKMTVERWFREKMKNSQINRKHWFKKIWHHIRWKKKNWHDQ